jgi:ubiquitin-protein ligase
MLPGLIDMASLLSTAAPQARPEEDDLLVFHYVIEGPKDTPYENGFYHGGSSSAFSPATTAHIS